MNTWRLREWIRKLAGMSEGAKSAGSEVAEVRCSRRHETAQLSDCRIESMLDSELVDLIRASEHPWADADMAQHLEFADRERLLRLAYLVRSCCQHAECAAHEQALLDKADGPQNRRDAGTLFGNPR